MFYKAFQPFYFAANLAVGATLAVAALAATVATALAFAGVLPWPDLVFTYGGALVPWAGQAAQIAFTVLLVGLLAVLPGAFRVHRLEMSHRRFEMDMDDVTRAYRAAHMADRAEMFGLRREFDSVRERYRFLREEPELAEIDTELLTVAAQMSHLSRDFAAEFSDEKVARLRESLRQRRVDAEDLQNRIQAAHGAIREIRRLMEDVDIEESTVSAQIERLREEVSAIGLADPIPAGPRLVVS